MPLFVWVMKNGKVFPQILHTEHVTGANTPQKLDIIAEFKITEEEATLPLSRLALDYKLEG